MGVGTWRVTIERRAHCCRRWPAMIVRQAEPPSSLGKRVAMSQLMERAGRLVLVLALALPMLAVTTACETSVGNNLKPLGMKQAGAGYVILIPLCPEEQILYVHVEGDGYEWYVSDPVHPQATELVLGDTSAFKTITTDTIPVGGLLEAQGSDEMHVSVSTSRD